MMPRIRSTLIVAAVVIATAACAGDEVSAPAPIVATGPSRAYGIWTPGPNDTCTKEQHDAYSVVGPDGKLYPTWHPPTDPEFGCTFGHEHGADPRTSGADGGLPAFGYAGKLAGFNEPHEGFKVFIMNNGTHTQDGRTVNGDYRAVS